jgi:bidirectional [NiFe] hydrogenase diaphorase subunit
MSRVMSQRAAAGAAVGSARVVTLKINDRDVSARSDETILSVARENHIEIPTLCFLEGLTAFGGCRMCLVEIQGVPRLLPACVTLVQEGMEVQTDTPRLQKYRRMVLEMLFAERNHVCSVCVSNGRCELQHAAQQHGMTHLSMPYRYPRLAYDSSHELFRMDHNRCILCTRCVRVCDEIEGAHTWDVTGRGIDSMIISDMAQPWGESPTCTRCGKCVQICPTGALSQKGTAVAEMTKRVGFLPYLTLMRSNDDE